MDDRLNHHVDWWIVCGFDEELRKARQKHEFLDAAQQCERNAELVIDQANWHLFFKAGPVCQTADCHAMALALARSFRARARMLQEIVAPSVPPQEPKTEPAVATEEKAPKAPHKAKNSRRGKGRTVAATKRRAG